ncbi:MAG: DUF805 domain-containing protein [Rhizomicrobium sp.]
MTFTDAVSACFRKYVDFEGRAPRSEFWFFRLFVALSLLGVFLLMALVAGITPDNEGGIQGVLFGVLFLALILGTFLPDLAVTVRRLHDRDYSGWWILIAFVPFGGLVLLIWFCTRGTEGENRFGPDPLAVRPAAFP